MTLTNTNLSKLTGYVKRGKSFAQEPAEPTAEEVITEVDTTIAPEADVVIESAVPETDEAQNSTDESEQQETGAETQTQEQEVEELESEEWLGLSEEELESEELDNEDRDILEMFNEIIKTVGRSKFEALQEFDERSMDKMITWIESQLRTLNAKRSKVEESLKQKENEIEELQIKIKDWEKEWKIKNHELSRYQIDDDDEYVLTLKQKLSKDPENQSFKDKLRDEYLRRISDVEPDFDMFESRNKIINKKSIWIDNLSASNRSTPPTFTKESSPVVTWYAKRSR